MVNRLQLACKHLEDRITLFEPRMRCRELLSYFHKFLADLQKRGFNYFQCMLRGFLAFLHNLNNLLHHVDFDAVQVILSSLAAFQI